MIAFDGLLALSRDYKINHLELIGPVKKWFLEYGSLYNDSLPNQKQFHHILVQLINHLDKTGPANVHKWQARIYVKSTATLN